MSNLPVVLQRSQRPNPHCDVCGKHLGLLYHDTGEHAEAVETLELLNRRFNQQPETD